MIMYVFLDGVRAAVEENVRCERARLMANRKKSKRAEKASRCSRVIQCVDGRGQRVFRDCRSQFNLRGSASASSTSAGKEPHTSLPVTSFTAIWWGSWGLVQFAMFARYTRDPRKCRETSHRGLRFNGLPPRLIQLPRSRLASLITLHRLINHESYLQLISCSTRGPCCTLRLRDAISNCRTIRRNVHLKSRKGLSLSEHRC